MVVARIGFLDGGSDLSRRRCGDLWMMMGAWVVIEEGSHDT